MFENLKKYKKIVVSGPQRSGTRIVGKAICHDTGHEYIDEQDFGIGAVGNFKLLVEKKEGPFVAQCPAVSRHVHELPDNVLVVFVMRDIDDIIASQERVGWDSEEAELEMYGVEEGPISEVTYEFWEKKQKSNIKHWKEIEYESLSEHPLWVPKEKRKGFAWNQTELGNKPQQKEPFPKIDYPQEEHPERLVAVERIREWGIDDDTVILDIGCGKNKSMEEAVGVDIDPSVADICNDGQDLKDIDDASVDYIIIRHCFEHFLSPLKALREIRRVLKVGGKAVIVLPDHERINTMASPVNDLSDPEGYHLHAYTTETFRDVVSLIEGLEVIETGLPIVRWSFFAVMEKKDV